MSPRYWYRVMQCEGNPAWRWTAGAGCIEWVGGFAWTQAGGVRRAERAVRRMQKRDHEPIEWQSR